jgi:arginyl-tRNA synthetase
VGIGAIKYADLSKHRSTDYVFNWDAMLSLNGNTGPYLQYAYTRIYSIFKHAKIDMTNYCEEVIVNNDEEKSLCLKILQFNEVLEQVAQDSLPHLLCSYLYELAGAFMSFYEKCPILKSNVAVETCQSRLTLCSKTGETICTGLDLLGIEVTEKM